ncbi:hypothetical protein K2173_015869 [Erythroxylum novogranatense]|uniref:Pectinesterase n=1 Tax=Erythroxylum novogranatense TaxID=1862640 RepID=A0AAV8SET1_9ROSI|nr:hypothetical protein K2173_015869 [Erythroxylum novogranatense]
MVFQDFDQISERRRLERERKFRKKVIIAAVSAFLLVGVVAAGVVAVVISNEKTNETSKENKAPQSQQQAPKSVSRVEKVIKTVCNRTSYAVTCQDTLKSAVQKNSSAEPKDFLKIAIQAADDEIEKVLDKASTFKFDSPKEKAAFEDCKELIEDAKEELKESIVGAGADIKNLTDNVPDLNNWLSAVMSYQQTCIDGFPEVKLRTDMEKVFKAAKELTSNSLALVSGISSLLSLLDVPGGAGRRLLEKKYDSPDLDNNGIPYWMSQEDRRMLKAEEGDKLTPNVTVAKDGSGNFTTISAALAAIPAKYDGRYVIYIKQGVYDEQVMVTKKMVNLTIYGDGSQKTIITGNKNFVDGVQTFRTASFAALGDGFLAKAIGFRNTAGPEKHQAVAARVQADRAIFLNCRFEGYQDTLYAQTHRQFYRSCLILGTIDFIFGDAAAIFQNCQILTRKPMANQQTIVTAQGRIDKHETTGIVLQNCRIEPDKELVPVKATFKSYLGRPWKEFSRTIIMESKIEDFIHPEGWLAWEGDKGLSTLYYAEYNNEGPGAPTTGRVKWPGYHVINKEEAAKFTLGAPFLSGEWINATGTPVHFGLFA